MKGLPEKWDHAVPFRAETEIKRQFPSVHFPKHVPGTGNQDIFLLVFLEKSPRQSPVLEAFLEFSHACKGLLRKCLLTQS